MIPESSVTGRLIKGFDTVRYQYTQPGMNPNLFEKIGRVVMIYLVIPAGVVAFGVATIVIDIGVETFTYLRGKQTGREWRTHVVAFAILFVTLPFRVVGYWVGKRDLLFPVDYRHKNPPNPTTTYPTFSFTEFRLTADHCILQNNPTYLQNLLGLPRVPYCDLGKIMSYAVEKRNRPLVNKLTAQGQSIDSAIGDQWWDRKTPLEKILKEAESLSNPDRQEALDFAAFLVDEKKAHLNTPEIERIATKYNQDIDIVRFLCKRGHRSLNSNTMVDLYLRLKDPELLSAFVDLHPRLSGWDRESALSKIMPFAVQEKNATLAKKILRKGYDITSYFTVNGGAYTSLIGHIHTQVKNPRHSERTRQEWLNFAKEILIDYFSSEKGRAAYYLLNSDVMIELSQLIKDPAIFLGLLKTSHYFSTAEVGKMLELAVREACSPSHPVAVRITWREVLAILITKGTIAPNKSNEFMDIARSVRDLEAGRLICRLGEMQFLSEAMNKATFYTQLDHLRFLLELHVNLNIYFPDGDTPLTKAVRSGYVDIVRMLLADSRLDRNLPRKSSSFFDFRGKTALQIAKEMGYIEIVRLLSDGKAEPKPEYEPPKSSPPPPYVPSVLNIPYFPRDLFPLDLCRRASEVESAKVKTTLFEKSRLAEFLSQIALGSKTSPHWGIFGVTEDEAVKMGSEEFNKITRKLLLNIHHDRNRALEGEDKVFCEQVYKAVFEVRQALVAALQKREQIEKNRA